jgi:hypothetical protein
MVGMGIVAMLLSIALVACRRVSQTAATVGCLNNQRQVAQAVLGYARRFQGTLPLAGGWAGIQGSNYVGWVRFVTDAGLLASPKSEESGMVDYKSVLFCPAKREFVGTIWTYYAPEAISDYGYTPLGGDCGRGDFEKVPNPWQQMNGERWTSFRSVDGKCGPYRIDEIKRPEEKVMLADACVRLSKRGSKPMLYYSSSLTIREQPEGYPGGYLEQWDPPGTKPRFPMHRGCVNITFLDGHGQTVQCPMDSKALARMLSVD